MTKHFTEPRLTVWEKLEQGGTYTVRGKYGRGEVRRSANGSGYVVDWVPSSWVIRQRWGKGPRMVPCKAFHTAIATVFALTHG